LGGGKNQKRKRSVGHPRDKHGNPNPEKKRVENYAQKKHYLIGSTRTATVRPKEKGGLIEST